MPGGGSLNVAPGQITDDGELTLALISAVEGKNPTDNYLIQDVSKAYVHWLKNPFPSILE